MGCERDAVDGNHKGENVNDWHDDADLPLPVRLTKPHMRTRLDARHSSPTFEEESRKSVARKLYNLCFGRYMCEE